MKKIALLSAVFALSLASCTVLDNSPYTEFTKSNYFTSETNVETYANYFYSEFKGYGNGGSYGDFYFNTLNDDQAARGITPWTYTSLQATNSVWNNAYEEIRRANIMIAAIPEIEDMKDDAKNNWLGVARLYRGWQHYKLVRAFGDCYWADHELNVDDEYILHGKRTDRDVVMDNVLEDLNFAAANISKNADSRVAFNVYVANAMKAEICLYEGTFCKYRSAADGQKAADATRAEKFLKECVAACEVIKNSGKYKLTPTIEGYRANFNSMSLAKNEEMILYKQYIFGTLGHSTIDYTCGSTPVMGMTKDAFDSYLFTDGKPLAETTLDKNDHGTVVTLKAADGVCDANHDAIDISALLAVRDPRLAAQVDPIVHFVDHGYARFGGSESTSTTGYGVMLFDTKEITTQNRQNVGANDTDAPIFWYAQILLNYAEACAELNKTAEATAAIDELRARAGMPNVATTGGDLLTNVRRERRVELMYACNDRYWSLIRWHQLNKLDTKVNRDITLGAWIGTMTGAATDNGYIDTKNNGMEREYNAKYYLFPIPTNEIALNPEIGQNYGW